LALDSKVINETIQITKSIIITLILQIKKLLLIKLLIMANIVKIVIVVDALDGEPGIYSARYSGSRDPKLNLELVLERMQGQTNRTARFVSVISLVLNGQTHLFRGEVEGNLATECAGVAGFGYDPIFIPNGYECTFAEMSLAEKNRISHRSKALTQLFQFLKTRT
jgi:XTP/dITP diphosphohydrolase